MKKVLLLAASALAIGVVAIGALGCSDYFGSNGGTPAAAANASSNQQNTGIWVTGVGKLRVSPDIALLSLGVEAQAATVAETQQEAAQAMDAVVSALTSSGIAQADIQTQLFGIQPVRSTDKDSGQEVLIGYRATNMVSVKIRNIENAGSVIDAAVAAGGDNARVNSISFTLDNPEAYNEQLRKEAMDDAKAKAKQLADLGGVKLGKPTYIAESSYIPPVYRAEAPAAPTTPISPGELEIQLTVQVIYSIG